MPLPRVLADYALDYLKQILVCGFGQAISSRVVGRGSRTNYIVLTTELKNLFRHESSTIIAHNLERDTETREYEILEKVHDLLSFHIF